MKFVWRKPLKYNTKVIMNRLGYHLHVARGVSEVSYVKRLGSSFYPRYHVYLQGDDRGIVVNIHYDEKKPSYRGTRMHSGQYGGELVSQEAQRIITYLAQCV